MLVFLNGQIIREEDAKISINDLSYQFGYGLFETIRCEEGTPVFLESHYKRISIGAKELGMIFPISLTDLSTWIKQTLNVNSFTCARIKVIVSKRTEEKFNVLIIASPPEQYPLSCSLITKVLIRDPDSISFRNKTTSRADSYKYFVEAKSKGFEDILYLNKNNELLECSRANVFLSVDDKLVTPPLSCGILSGVTRSKIIEIAKKEALNLEEKNVHRLYLNKATGVFLTSSIKGVAFVSKVVFEDKEYLFKDTPIINRLRNAYDAEVQEYLKKNKKPARISS